MIFPPFMWAENNKINFKGRIWVDAESNGQPTRLPLQIPDTNDITALLGVNWLKHLHIIINKTSLDKKETIR